MQQYRVRPFAANKWDTADTWESFAQYLALAVAGAQLDDAKTYQTELVLSTD